MKSIVDLSLDVEAVGKRQGGAFCSFPLAQHITQVKTATATPTQDILQELLVYTV